MLNYQKYPTISTKSCLKNIQECANDKLHIVFLYMFSFHTWKAFNHVDYTLLLDKLSYHGIRCIVNRLFKSWISNYTQHVSINDFNFNHKLMKYGIPQCSVLGPLLFLINYQLQSKKSILFCSWHLLTQSKTANKRNKQICQQGSKMSLKLAEYKLTLYVT